jgi:putative ABC transport system permease protein
MSFGLGFQDVAGIRLKRGRWLDQSKGNAILINETLARSLFPGEDPVGKFVRPQGANPAAGREWKGWEVAGVVGDIRSKLRDAPGNMIYSPESWSAQGFNVLVVRLGREFDVSFADSLRRRLYAFDSRLVVHAVMSVSEARDNQLWVERMANSVLKVLAGIALLLTVVGMFSVLAYTVDRRMGEFGVRMALGATKRDLAELVLRRGVRLTLVGVAFGLAGTLALSKFLRTLLFGTTPNDPWVLAAVGVILLFTSVVACVLPARRAARVDVARLLRSE